MSMDHKMICLGLFCIGLIIVCGGFVLAEAMRLVSVAQEETPVNQQKVNKTTTQAIIIFLMIVGGCGVIAVMTIGFSHDIKNNIDKAKSESISSR